MSERVSQMAGLVATIDPLAAPSSTTKNSDVIDASLYDSIMFIASVGANCCSSGNLTMTVFEGTSTGTVTTSVGATTHAKATGGENFQYIFDLDCADLSGPNYRYVKAQLKSTGKPMEFSLVGLGFKPRYHPASAGDLASVKAIKTST